MLSGRQGPPGTKRGVDYGDEEELEQTRVRVAQISESERGPWVWNEIVALRRRHYPAAPGG